MILISKPRALGKTTFALLFLLVVPASAFADCTKCADPDSRASGEIRMTFRPALTKEVVRIDPAGEITRHGRPLAELDAAELREIVGELVDVIRRDGK